MLFAPLEGSRRVAVTERRTKVDSAHLVRNLLDADYPDNRVVLVMDNLNTHTAASLDEAFEAAGGISVKSGAADLQSQTARWP